MATEDGVKRFNFKREVAIRWADADALGHVNHACFLTYLEEGRDAFFRGPLTGTDYAIVRIEIDFRRELLLDHRRAIVEIAVERVGRTSITTCEGIRDAAGELVAEASVVSVRWDPAGRRPTPLTHEERSRLLG